MPTSDPLNALAATVSSILAYSFPLCHREYVISFTLCDSSNSQADLIETAQFDKIGHTEQAQC